MSTFSRPIGLSVLGKRCRNIYEEQINHLSEEYQTDVRKHKKRYTYVSVYDKIAELVSDRDFGVSPGDENLRKLKKILDSFKWARSADQFKLSEDFIKISLPIIYGEHFEANRMRLMKAFGIKDFQVGALTLTPRRWGKTTIVAMFVVALLMVCDGKTIAIFSGGGRASTSLRNEVLRLLDEVGGMDRLVHNRKELLSVAVPSAVNELGQLKYGKEYIKGAGLVNRLFAFPASVRGKSSCLGCFCVHTTHPPSEWKLTSFK